MQQPYRPPGAQPITYGNYNPAIPNQSGLGIASFVIGALCLLSSIVVIASFVTKVRASVNSNTLRPMMFDVALLGLSVIAIMFVALIGLILGFVALSQPHRNRAMSILGTILNGLIILGFIALMVIGQTRTG